MKQKQVVSDWARHMAGLTHTYSIVARDPETGQMGAAVQSHSFAVGNVVPWVMAGRGAVVVQSFSNREVGPVVLQLLEKGLSAKESLEKVLKHQPDKDLKQVAVVDTQGEVANFSGKKVLQPAAMHKGDGYSVQVNFVESEDVCDAMARAYEEASGPLADRLLAALYAGEREGGDMRGMRSASMRVVTGKSDASPEKWTLLDLRVDDHERPLDELSHLYHAARAENQLKAAFDALARGNEEQSLKYYKKAREARPDDHEVIFWEGVLMLRLERVEDALPLFKKAYDLNPGWKRTVRHLAKIGLFPDDEGLIRKVLGVMR